MKTLKALVQELKNENWKDFEDKIKLHNEIEELGISEAELRGWYQDENGDWSC